MTQKNQIKNGLITGADQKARCSWCGDDPEYMRYHDEEWGRLARDDTRLFEKICLEGFQAGLSWLTILRKRDNFRTAFDGFAYHKIAHYTDHDVERLVQNAGIIRHRGKIESTINNAKRAIEMEQEFGSLAHYFWRWKPPQTERPKICDYESLSAITMTPTSKALSKDLKKRGWSFVGPTTAYAFMQAMGLVNDHVEGCAVRDEVARLQAAFQIDLA